jgi:signal transduction histidine kinase
MQQAQSTREPGHYEFRTLWPDGQVRTILTRYQVALDDEGNLVRMLGVNQDVTERKRFEQQILRSERLATLGQLNATVSHELRNPLGVIRTSNFIVREGLSGETPRVRRALERIERSVVRCDRIIDELLDFTRIKELQLEPILIDEWLGNVLGEQAPPKGFTLRCQLGLPEVEVRLDPDRLRRAVINVFDNACQAMTGEAGEEAAGTEEHVLSVKTRKSNGRIEVVFEDTGPGIPSDVHENVFEPLFSTKGFGVGLGLPVVKHIMEQHGGGIEIESGERRGTRVCLWLPTSHSTH